MRGARPVGAIRTSVGRRSAELRLRRLAAAVRDAERLRGAVFGAAPDAIVISDAEGRVRAVNAAAEAVFGRPGPALIGLWMSDLVAASGVDPQAARGNILAALGQRVRLEGIGGGGRFPAEVTVQRVGHGRSTRFAAFIRDLSDEQRAAAVAEAQRRQLADVEKLSAMGALLSGVAHELNNPLAIVAAQAMLLRERATDADVARRAERIHTAAQRAGRIVRSFTALATRRPALREPLPLGDVFAEARDLVAYRLRQNDIAVEADLPADLPMAAGDADLIVQVFVNLLLNAQEALLNRPGDRRIAVLATAEPETVSVEIADNGPGVAAKVAQRLFEPYVTTKAPGAGIGIGLSLCRSVLDQHGGTIVHRPGQPGAVFRMTLPRSGSAASSVPAAPAGALRVLVVDDEIDVGRALAELIEIFGHSVGLATSAEEALERIATATFDAVFTDVHMPQLDGAALRARIAATRPELAARTVLVTGDMRRHAGTDDGLGLEKPFTAAAVQALLTRLGSP